MKKKLSVKKLLGWKPEPYDPRDYEFKMGYRGVELPIKVDMRPGMPPIFKQDHSDCTANVTASQCWYIDKTDPFEPSRLFIYYNSRRIEGTTDEDGGAYIRDSIKSVVKWGFCSTNDWPYKKGNLYKKPNKKAYDNALKEKVTQYRRVRQLEEDIKSALAQGYPINFGIMIHSSIDSEEVNKTGIIPMPKKGDAFWGGHAVLLVGYDDEKQLYTIRNSWGIEWGDDGYGYLPYDYVHNHKLASDFWVVNAVV